MTAKSRLSLPLLLTVLIPILTGLLLFALVLFSFRAGHSVAVEVHERDIQELVDLAGSSIEELWITPRTHTALALSRSEVLHRRLKGETSFEELADEWAAVQRNLKGYFFIYYGLEDGTIEHYPNDPLPEDYDPRERPWYKLGMSSDGQPLWTSPYKEIITGDMVVSTVVPIWRSESTQVNGAGGGSPIGVLSMDMTFQALEQSLENINLPTGGSGGNCAAGKRRQSKEIGLT